MAFILASAALSKLVVATDCADAPADTLTEFYHERSDEEVGLGLRLFYCAGLAIALASMGVISFSHEHKLFLTCRMPKWLRLCFRGAVCIIIICLPAAPPETLSSLGLVSITTGLTVGVLLVELWGKSCEEDTFWGDSTTCRYTAKCSKKRLEEALKDGEVDVVELGRNEKTAAPDVS
jgi:hypothetical protein